MIGAKQPIRWCQQAATRASCTGGAAVCSLAMEPQAAAGTACAARLPLAVISAQSVSTVAGKTPTAHPLQGVQQLQAAGGQPPHFIGRLPHQLAPAACHRERKATLARAAAACGAVTHLHSLPGSDEHGLIRNNPQVALAKQGFIHSAARRCIQVECCMPTAAPTCQPAAQVHATSTSDMLPPRTHQ